ncbi:F-box/LRR-repeat protein 7-like [Pollicipes pollicipes]|uniref:F-box/LRR-repeat protein 7-like n=1 Tax=Pollicipes pollicipes TaxID=41117 RepID=UPI001885377F|nr:F-box/LRR-repeat protein 7-like [Pollicipes pollicipes]
MAACDLDNTHDSLHRLLRQRMACSNMLHCDSGYSSANHSRQTSLDSSAAVEVEPSASRLLGTAEAVPAGCDWPRRPPLEVPPSTDFVFTRLEIGRARRPAPFVRLSDELALRVFSHLSADELSRCARVCRRWRRLAWQPCLWSDIRLTGGCADPDGALGHIFRLLGCDRLTRVQSSSAAGRLRLRHLDLSGCGRLNGTLGLVAGRCPALRELSVGDCPRVTDAGVRRLAPLGPGLRHLSLAHCRTVSDAGVAQLALSCRRLRYLNVRGCATVGDASLAAVARGCRRLCALDVGRSDASDLGLRLLAQHCPDLRRLSVRGCEMVSDAGVRLVALHCRGLRQVSVQDSAVTLEGCRTVKKYCKRCTIEHSRPGFY